MYRVKLGLCNMHYSRLRRHGYTELQTPHWRTKPKITKKCLNCGDTFSVKPSLDRVKYCSKSCAKIGKPSPNWQGGITSESVAERNKFGKTIQPLVLARDNYTCQMCDQYSGYLHVDHIKSWADYPELRFDMDNCRTLCRACHYYLTFKRKLPVTSTWGIVRRIS